MIRFFVISILIVALQSCKSQSIDYDLNKPNESHKLPKKLIEVSGLQWLSDSILLTVQDEKGKVYFFNTKKGEDEAFINFAKDGDYEGVAVADKAIYALKSNGTVYQIIDGNKEKIEFPNSKKFDFEGLCYNSKSKQLLVACKEHGKKERRDFVYIYSIDLTKLQYNKKAFIKISQKHFKKPLKPSAIAIHPNGNIYVLSSATKRLVVLSQQGVVLNDVGLSKELFPQPEGITFSPKGDLFISNEAPEKSKKATLYLFNPIRQ